MADPKKLQFKQSQTPTEEAAQLMADVTARSGPATAELNIVNPHVVVRDAITPAQAAEVLFQYLPGMEQEKIAAAKQQMFADTPLWAVLLGYVLNCSERFEIYHPKILDAWRSGRMPSAPRPCETCGEMFTSPHGDARRCCNPCAFGKLHERGHAKDCTTQQVA